RKDCEECKNRPKCVEEAPLICNDCLHEVLKSEFDSWSSGNVQIDEFIRNAQRGEFGAIISAKWSQDMNQLSLIQMQHQDLRNCCNLYGITQDLSTLEYMLVEPTSVCDGCLSNPCAVALKQLKGEKDTVYLFLKEIEAQFNCCHLYGVTKDPSTSQYMFVMRYAPQGDLRRFLQKNFDKLTLENKLTIAQSICIELQNIHAKGWVHGDLHGGNILLLNEEDAFISDFGLCRPTNETHMLEKKIYGVIPNIAPEILRFQSPYSQAGDIYSLGIILWELVCGIPAFSNRAHCVNLITDICNGLRPKTCHFAPPIYNDLLKKCWNQNPSKRPSINAVIDCIQLLRTKEFTLDEYESKYYLKKQYYESMSVELKQVFENSDKATKIYNIMKWKPDAPIHPEAVYKSRMISVSNEYMTRQNDMTLQYEVCDIP
ncbi:45361_t:CDS:2, partial [Gigaspora margarita]